MRLSDIFYEDQANWEQEDFYQLMRNMNRLFNYIDRYSAEINELELDKMSLITKTFMAAVTSIPQRNYLWKQENLKELSEVKPFIDRFDIVPNPSTGNAQMVKYNIGW